MASVRDHYVLVPNASRGALLVAGSRLPCVRGARGAEGVLDALRRAYGLDAPYLRPAKFLLDADGNSFAGLHELDAPGRDWEPAPGTSWLALDDADPDSLAPFELTSSVGRWLAIARGASVPAERPPWAKPGWLAEALRWIDESAAAAGLDPNGPVEVVEQWPLSAVLRRDTNSGRVYMKAVFSTFRHEPALTQALSARHPMLIPEVLAVDIQRGWMLMSELPGTQIGDVEGARWSDALRAVAGVHRDWAARADELLALGAHDRTVAALASEIRATFHAVGLAADDRTLSQLERRCEELAEGPLPQTLVHGDFHPWNVMVEEDELRIFDWSDACVSHPLFDLPTFLQRTESEAAREQMLEAYLAAWADLGSPEELRTSYELALPLAHVHHAVSYLRINEALEPDDQWWFADEPRRWLTGAVERLSAP